ncbi:MAG: YitT family protein [Actinomycetes bacterium]
MAQRSREDNQRHSFFEDIFGIVSGSILFSVGLSLMHSSEVLTGGVAGMALLIAKRLDAQIGTVYLLIGAPFLVLAFWKKGWRFTLRSALSMAFVSLLTNYMPKIFSLQIHNKLLATVIANILLGVGMVVIFRHFSSLGGFNVIALVAQEKFGFKAGYVQLVLDFLVLLAGLTSYSTYIVMISLIGDALLNISLAINHRSDRYLGHSY